MYQNKIQKRDACIVFGNFFTTLWTQTPLIEIYMGFGSAGGAQIQKDKNAILGPPVHYSEWSYLTVFVLICLL